MSASASEPNWGDAVVRAPQALGLGAPRRPAQQVAVAAPPPITAVPSSSPAGAKTVRLPTEASDQEGIYEGLLWAVRALEECGRVFTRLSSRLGKLESRLASLEAAGQKPAADACAERASAVETQMNELESRMTAVDTRVKDIESERQTIASRPIDPQVAALRKELIAAQVRLARLEGADDRASRRRDDDTGLKRSVDALAQRLESLERDVVGVYRELDGVAERVTDRLAVAGLPLDADASQDEAEGEPSDVWPVPEPAAVVPAGPPDRCSSLLAPMPVTNSTSASAPASTSDGVRERAASVLTAELVRILHSLDALGREEVRRTQ